MARSVAVDAARGILFHEDRVRATARSFGTIPCIERPFMRLLLCYILLLSPYSLRAQGDTVRLGPGSPALDGLRYRDHSLATVVTRTRGDSTLSAVRFGIDVRRTQEGGRTVEHVTVGPLPGGPDPGVRVLTLLDPQTTLPLHYEVHTGNGDLINVDFDGTHVTGQRRAGTDSTIQRVDITLSEPAFLAAYEDAALDAVHLVQGMILRVPVVRLSSNGSASVQSYVYHVVRRETLQLNGHSAQAWVVEAHDTLSTSTMWLIDEPPYTVKWVRVSSQGIVTLLEQTVRAAQTN
jgi:hypothetical protein